MIASLQVLRGAGFFKEYADLTDEEIIGKVLESRRARLLKNFGFENVSNEEIDSLLLAEEDDKKLLHFDMESVCSQDKIYTKLLLAFKNLSAAGVSITNISEVWNSDEGPITVTYRLNNSDFSFETAFNNDWIDDSFIHHLLDDIYNATGELFPLCIGPNLEWLGQEVHYIRLTVDERMLLQQKLGWKFYDELIS